MRSLNVLLTIVILGSSGCGVSRYAELRADGIHYLHYDYRVKYVNPLSRTVLLGWLLDNFHTDDSGTMVLNQSKNYYGTALIDRNGDGKYEKEKAYFFDLKLNHRSSNAVLWIQNQELSEKAQYKKVDSLLESYVQSLTGAGFYAEANVFSILTVKQKRFVAVVKEKKRTRLGPYKALSVRIQIFNIDQRKIQPKHQGTMLQITLLKLPYQYDHSGNSEYPDVRSGFSVMIIGYRNSAAAFPKHFPAYQKLLGLVEFKKER